MLKSPGSKVGIDWFCEQIQNAPLAPAITNEERFLTFAMIYILVRALSRGFEFDDEAVELFQKTFRPVVDSAFAQYARPLIGRLDPHMNRFATARFELDVLLPDCQKGFDNIAGSIGLPGVLKKLALQNVIAILDARAANRILASPGRLSFGNSVIWLSFLTALATAISRPFKITLQVCRALQMAPSICTSPKLAEEVCPDLSKGIVLFLMTSLKPDELFARNIDASRFVSTYRLDPTVHPEPIEPVSMADYMELIDEIPVRDWNACTVPPELLQRFPHLAQFLRSQSPNGAAEMSPQLWTELNRA
jgi:hypothetical protein